MRTSSTIALASVAAMLLLALPAAAGAATVMVRDGALVVADGAGETNDLTLRTSAAGAGTVDVHDAATAPVAGDGCWASGTDVVTCVGVATIVATLGAGDDRLILRDAEYPAKVDLGAGDDTVDTSSRSSSLDGGAGTDRIVVNGTPRLTKLRDSSIEYTREFPDRDTITSFEQATYRGTPRGDKFSAYRFSGPVLIMGGGGDDFLAGGSGDDRLVGHGGDDVLNGGTGTDQVQQHSRRTVATPTQMRGSGTDRITSMERLYVTGPYSSEAGIVVDATRWRGPSLLVGGTGNDVIRGGSGPDDMIPNGGLDRIYGNAGADRIDANPRHVLMRPGTIFDGGAGPDRIISSGTEQLFGGSGNDFIHMLNQRKDRSVSCGSGIDTVRIDYADRHLPGSDCERES